MGKKQMSEFTSKLTKPYFYFFPGLASENSEEVEEEEVTSNELIQNNLQTNYPEKANESFDDICKWTFEIFYYLGNR